jgi:hypothetical protein
MNKTPPGRSLDGAVSGFVRCRAQLFFPERGYSGIQAAALLTNRLYERAI